MNWTTLSTWLQAVTGYSAQHVIREQGAGKRPTGNHLTFGLVTSQIGQYPDTRRTVAPTVIGMDYRSLRRETVGIDVYALDGQDLLDKLYASENVGVYRRLLRGSNMAIQGRGAVQDLTGLGDVGFRPRFRGDFVFYTWHNITENVERILELDLQGDFGGI